MKVRLFEFENFKWFPSVLRNGMTDYLRFIFTVFNLYEPVIFLLNDSIVKTNFLQIIDLCSGSGGAIEQIQQNLKKQFNCEIQILLTDKFPNISAYEFLFKKTNGTITYSPEIIDATDVPHNMKGLRTIFSGFHHFDTITAKKVLQNTVDSKQNICIFDGGDKNLLIILIIIFLQPIGFLLFTPFIKPFRFSRIFFTYIIPLIPLCTIWDGIVSISRLYKPSELLQMAESIETKNYLWKSGKIKNKFGMRITYLTGYQT